MWRGVIHQAVMDATRPVTESETALQDYERRTSRLWLTTFCDDFVDVCSRAELDPYAVRGRGEALQRLNWIIPEPPKPEAKP